ncbi:DUF1848 domain-containing protein [bacterium]|nr:DUF1848 domain-containing protein [bacterium]
MDTPLIISASRTKDMVHRSPGLLAKLLLGEADCRWGPYAPFGRIDPAAIHSIVLWTKDPHALISHPDLNQTLWLLKKRFNVQIALQITATGFGGSFIEPGIPRWESVVETVQRIFQSGLIQPQATVYRFDPFLKIHTPGGRCISNINFPIFETLSRAFINLGIKRVTTSRADAVRYPMVAQRLAGFNLTLDDFEEQEAFRFCQMVDADCQHKEADFSICCEPQHPTLLKWGCIDGRWLNQTKGSAFPRATEILHNKIGRQRPACRCTYSRDIGYSTGSKTCFSGGFGCLYCYSQGSANPPHLEKIIAEIADFDRHPQDYLKAKGLHPSLHCAP